MGEPVTEPVRWIIGPCVLAHDGRVALQIAHHLAALAARLGVPIVFKASFDKANRTRGDSFRGPGLERGLELLAEIHRQTGLPILTDVHEPWQAEPVAAVAHILQVPAFLCRQTDLITAVAATGRVVNIKKGQLLAPEDVVWPVDKARRAGAAEVWITERGTAFGYHNLVVDPEGLAAMLELADAGDFEVVFDATHAVQRPSAQGGVTGGARQRVPALLRAAAAIGVRRFFLETWPDPDDPRDALSDAANAVPLASVEALILQTNAVCDVVRGFLTGPGSGRYDRA